MAATSLIDRRREREVLDGLLADVLAGASRAIVLRGEAGVGKSALLDHLSAPDRFLVGLAVLTLFAEVAERQPLICIVDDAQWLDQTSAQIIGFVARRLLAERVALVCAARTGIGDHVMAGQPALRIEGLHANDARALLLNNMHGPLDAAVCEQIIAECHGNPLALLELPRGLTATQLAGGFGLMGIATLPGRIEETFWRRLDTLAAPTRSIMLIAAADPAGDPLVLWRAARSLGIDTSAVAAGETDGLMEIAAQVRFRHPLVPEGPCSWRSAAPRWPSDRRQDRHSRLTSCSTASLSLSQKATPLRFRSCSRQRRHSPVSPRGTSCSGAGRPEPPTSAHVAACVRHYPRASTNRRRSEATAVGAVA